MKICGFQKMTMLDFPGKVACTVFTGGCNFRCPFCHNALLVTDIDNDNTFDEEEIIEYLYKRKGIIDGVCITGGEPLLQKDIADFLRKVKETGMPVKLDTNGSYPEKLKELVSNGLVDYVAMDIKNAPCKYALTVGAKAFNLSPVYESIEIIKNSGVDYEFRTTVTKTFHDEESLLETADMIKDAKVWYLQSYRESENVIDKTVEGYSEAEMKALYERVKEKVPFVRLR